MGKNYIYFAHPVNSYNTELERILAEKIKEKFPRYDLENPNQKHHQENYRLWKEKTGSGMKYYFNIVLPKMEAGIGLSFDDGKFGFGVFGELEFLFNLKKPVWKINVKGEIEKIEELSSLEVLSLEETRKRVYGIN